VRAKTATRAALAEAIRAAGVACEAIGDGVAIRIDDWTAYEPDALVNCGPPLPDETIFPPNPLVVVEVTSPSNSRVDLNAKLVAYFSVSSIRHYLVVHLAKRVVIHHARGADGRIATAIQPAGPLTLDPPGITLEAAALFGAA
jgi:Uma2 family endonuclease